MKVRPLPIERDKSCVDPENLQDIKSKTELKKVTVSSPKKLVSLKQHSWSKNIIPTKYCLCTMFKLQTQLQNVNFVTGFSEIFLVV
jgi:hypothetical protein